MLNLSPYQGETYIYKM